MSEVHKKLRVFFNWNKAIQIHVSSWTSEINFFFQLFFQQNKPEWSIFLVTDIFFSFPRDEGTHTFAPAHTQMDLKGISYSITLHPTWQEFSFSSSIWLWSCSTIHRVYFLLQIRKCVNHQQSFFCPISTITANTFQVIKILGDVWLRPKP